MAVRNFWIDVDVDGRATTLSGGPRAKDGGMAGVVKQRNNGGIDVAFRFDCAEVDGRLVTRIFDRNGAEVFSMGCDR